MHKNTSPVRIVIAHGRTLFREALRRVLESESEFEVTGEAADGSEAIARTRELAPDILLLDFPMFQTGLIDPMRALSSGGDMRLTKVVLLTEGVDREQIARAVHMGARGVVTSETSAQLLMKAIRTVQAGQYWISRHEAGDIIDFMRNPLSADGPPRNYGLTSQQLRIVIAIAGGLSNKEIAQKLSITEDTVKHHLTKIFEKLGVSSRLQLAFVANTTGLMEGASG